MHPSQRHSFMDDFLFKSLGPSRKSISYRKRQIIYAAGDRSDSIFIVERGTVKLTVASAQGREAVTAILDKGRMFGEEALDANRLPRSSNAVALTQVQVTKIDRDAILGLLFANADVCSRCISHLVRAIADLKDELADNLIYNSEQRLARALLSIAHANTSEDYRRVPHLSQQDFANMIGTTRQRVNALMQRFRKLGFIDYARGLRVHRSLQTVAGTLEPELPADMRRLDS